MRHSIFISVATAEFGTLRAQLRDTLARSFDVVVQPDFPATASDTVRKLDDLIAPCDLVVHLVGTNPGSQPIAGEVADFFNHTAREDFLNQHDQAKKLLGEFDHITYVNWEPWLALHRDIAVIVYAVEGHDDPSFPQREHLDTLRTTGRYPATLREPPLGLAQITADVYHHFGLVPPEPKPPEFAKSRILRHAPDLLFGREPELAMLDDAWASRDSVHILSLIAWGGAGKTSLVAKWMADSLLAKGWPGVERYFDWSFYSQGSRENSQSSADLFIDAALRFFGDPDPTAGGPHDRGERLAKLVKMHRTLLILDGLEPLQFPGNDAARRPGELKDEGLRALLGNLAMGQPGLCILTSREALSDLRPFESGVCPKKELDQLAKPAAVSLLRHLQITGTDEELEAACEDAGGHALTLQMLGRFLCDAHGGDIRKRDLVDLGIAGQSFSYRNAFGVIRAYETWLADAGGAQQARDLAILRLTGLFDRPADPDSLAALRQEPAIPGLTEHIVGLSDTDWNLALKDLERLRLVSLGGKSETRNPKSEPEATAEPLGFRDSDFGFSIDAHPLIREYFAAQLQQHLPESYQLAHSRLFDHLRESTEQRPDTITGLQPLYQAVTHGCLAGRHQEACDKVFYDRIKRGDEFFSSKKLGAIGSDLGAIAAFFDEPWSRLSPNLSEPALAWLLNEAAFSLRALGRLTEALEPMREVTEITAKLEDWKSAAISASNLSELELTLGQVPASVADGRRTIDFADRSGDGFQRESKRCTAADALHQSGEGVEATALFQEAEGMQQARRPEFEFLYSLGGFRYCDLLLAPAEREFWRAQLSLDCGSLLPLSGRQPAAGPSGQTSDSALAAAHPPQQAAATQGGSGLPQSKELTLAACDEALRRATSVQNRRMGLPTYSLLDIALDHLTLARARLYRMRIAESARTPNPNDSEFRALQSALDEAVSGLRQANDVEFLAKALLARAAFEMWKWECGVRHSSHAEGGTRSAEDAPALIPDPNDPGFRDLHSALDEAELIAQRGPMPLYLADVHLHRARIFRNREELAKARALIEKHGYGRRREELADAEEAAKHWP